MKRLLRKNKNQITQKGMGKQGKKVVHLKNVNQGWNKIRKSDGKKATQPLNSKKVVLFDLKSKFFSFLLY